MLIVDEIASLTAYIGDRKVRTEVEQLLGLLLSQGRAVGVSVIAAVQDPSKDVLPIRQLFSIRIGMRMTETSQTTMVLGTAARDAGAVCDQIPTTTPGVGYVCPDGTLNRCGSAPSMSPTPTSTTSCTCAQSRRRCDDGQRRPQR